MDPKLLFLTRARKFSGKGGENWDTWISHFEAQTPTFDDEGRLQCLLSLLEDDALDAMLALPVGVKVKYATVKAALHGRFGRKVDRLQAHAELSRAVQEPGESVETFGDRIRKLGRLAYPDASDGDRAVESSLTSRFICGLQDEWTQSKACSRNPETLMEAIQLVQTLRSRQEALQAVRATTATALSATSGTSRGPGEVTWTATIVFALWNIKSTKLVALCEHSQQRTARRGHGNQPTKEAGATTAACPATSEGDVPP